MNVVEGRAHSRQARPDCLAGFGLRFYYDATGRTDSRPALGIEQHEIWWQFAKAPAWAPFRADAAGTAMLRKYGFA